jgi:uncharacterized Zn-finger protein
MGLRDLTNNRVFLLCGLVMWLVSSVFILLLLGRIDWIVNNQLYDFGLQFSLDWAVGYWMALRMAYVCFGVSLVLGGFVFVSSFFKSGGGKRLVVKREVRAAENVVQPVKEGNNHMLASCPSCKKVFAKPLVMLDFSGGKTRLVNVCPYCNHVLGTADEKQEDLRDVGVVDLDERKVEER